LKLWAWRISVRRKHLLEILLSFFCLVANFSIAQPVETSPCINVTTTPWLLRGDSFSPIDHPKYVLEYINPANATQNILELLQASVIILDGKRYSRREINFDGNPNISPCATYKVAIELGAYLPWRANKAKNGGGRIYSPSKLKEGEHRLIVDFGGRQSKAFDFYCPSSGCQI
jgi:hypothetical protein